MVIVRRSQEYCRDCSHQAVQKAELSAWHLGNLDRGWELLPFMAAFIHVQVREAEWLVEKTPNPPPHGFWLPNIQNREA